MICGSCKNEFDNIDGLKFCPYCGTKIEERLAAETEGQQEDIRAYEDEADKEKENKAEEAEENKKIHDTLEMPAITEKDIRKYKRRQFLSAVKAIFTKMKVVIPLVTVCLVLILGVTAYSFFVGKPVDEVRIKEDLTGKVLILPKGTNMEIKKEYIKSFSISSRNTSKKDKKDDINAAVTLNNGTLEVNTVLAFQYVYQGKNQWKINDKIEIGQDTSVKPVAVMDENNIIEAFKSFSITLGDTEKSLGGEDVKTLKLLEREPNLDAFQEDVLAEVGIDSDLIAASGKIKGRLIFENEMWSLSAVERQSNEDFTLALSPNFQQDKVLETVKKDVLEETVAHEDVFSGKGFYVKDSFTKSINIADKKFDAQNGRLVVTAKRENTAGELKSVLSADYTFSLSFTKLEFLKKSKTVVDSVAVNEITKDFIISSVVNKEIEGSNLFFWYSDNHKITADEAKTFKTDKILSKKGLKNVKYVYGTLTYDSGNKQKTVSLVAVYFLVYDNSKGYTWKLDKIVGEESPNYKSYIPEPH